MNNREEPLNNRIRKKITKEVRSGQNLNRAAVASQPTTRNLRGQNSAQRPRKAVKHEQSVLEKLKSLVSRKKAPAKNSKRATPGGVHDSAPAYPHKEGARWMKTVEKQTLDRAKTLRARMGKQTTKR